MDYEYFVCELPPFSPPCREGSRWGSFVRLPAASLLPPHPNPPPGEGLNDVEACMNRVASSQISHLDLASTINSVALEPNTCARKRERRCGTKLDDLLPGCLRRPVPVKPLCTASDIAGLDFPRHASVHGAVPARGVPYPAMT